MNKEPKRTTSEKELRVRRGRVASVDLYEIKDSELDLLEKGAPSGLYLNFSIFLLSISFSAIAALSTATFSSGKIETLFMIIAVVGMIGGLLLLLLWWRNRKSVFCVVEEIRKRIPPEQEISLSNEEPDEPGEHAPKG